MSFASNCGNVSKAAPNNRVEHPQVLRSRLMRNDMSYHFYVEASLCTSCHCVERPSLEIWHNHALYLTEIT